MEERWMGHEGDGKLPASGWLIKVKERRGKYSNGTHPLRTAITISADMTHPTHQRHAFQHAHIHVQKVAWLIPSRRLVHNQ